MTLHLSHVDSGENTPSVCTYVHVCVSVLIMCLSACVSDPVFG